MRKENDMQRIRFTEGLDLDIEEESWYCNRCGYRLGSARENYKKGTLVYERDASEIYPQVTEARYDFSPNKDWTRILEFYCPGCGLLLDVENLPPGHPITHDIEPNIDKLKTKLKKGSFKIENGRLRLAKW